jgi:hypothetical protein
MSRSFLLRIKNVLDKRCTENQNIRFLFNNFFFGNSVACEMMWKNTVVPKEAQIKYGACVLHAG